MDRKVELESDELPALLTSVLDLPGLAILKGLACALQHQLGHSLQRKESRALQSGLPSSQCPRRPQFWPQRPDLSDLPQLPKADCRRRRGTLCQVPPGTSAALL